MCIYIKYIHTSIRRHGGGGCSPADGDIYNNIIRAKRNSRESDFYFDGVSGVGSDGGVSEGDCCRKFFVQNNMVYMYM